MSKTEGKLDFSDLHEDPIQQFSLWFEEWKKVAYEKHQHPVTLATADASGKPSARVVLLKSFDDRGFVFYTNYESRKGRELTENPRAVLLFYWPELARQVRIEGTVERLSTQESDAYFATRDRDSQLGAWASQQSWVIEDRDELEEKFAEVSKQYPDKVPRPSYWGGYRVRPNLIEFWQGRTHRLHDRLVYQRSSGLWRTSRLSP